MIFSIYSLLLFGELCHPVWTPEPKQQIDDPRETFYWGTEISCRNASKVKRYWRKNLKDRWEILESMVDLDFRLEYSIAQFSWVVLVGFTCIFCIREIVECLSLQRKFFKSFDSYRHIMIDILLILCLLKGYPVASSSMDGDNDLRDNNNFKLQRWQYHVATLTSFLLWLQMMIVAGKYPGYGKYIYMFR